MKKLFFLALALAPACAGVADEDTLSKEEARQLGGKADGFDLCESAGWYGDGICDDFCPEPDPDCGGEEPAETCGGFAGLTCGEGEYCEYEGDSCGFADQLGTCEPMPEVCAEVFAPVCGCDGQTYSNQCHANGAGVSVAHDGACDEPDQCFGAWVDQFGNCRGPADGVLPEECCADQVQTCGGFAGLTCDEGEYCEYEGDSCGFADQLGTCEPMPDFCPEIFAPVCGCDGQTYSNDCFAHSAGVSVTHQGPCS